MLRSHCSILVFAILGATLVDLFAQPFWPPAVKTDDIHAQSQQQTTTRDQRGTEQQPLVVQPLPTKKGAEEAGRDAREANDKANSDWWTWFLSVLTLLVLFGQAIILAVQAYFLRGSLKIADKSATTAEKSTAISFAIENPLPLIGAFKLVQYDQIPGETSIVDPVPGGFIPPNCRMLFLVENKGRAVLRMPELCVEKFIGASLPSSPTYRSGIPWGLYLEKGPIWIRFNDEQSVITASEASAANASYPEGAFWVYGYIAYLDLFNERLQYKFLWRWDLTTGFVPENRTGYT